jgi:hypothetical protein
MDISAFKKSYILMGMIIQLRKMKMINIMKIRILR